MLDEGNSAPEAPEAEGLSRRGALECMVWAGTGILWTLSGGVPKSLGLLSDALAGEASAFTFLQISDSHVGFNKPANPDALGTLREAIAKVKAVASKPAFMIHTGDITHLSKPDEFDNAAKLMPRLPNISKYWVSRFDGASALALSKV
jgi:3',5'-cyclic-AMP phosphodiesterase